MLLPRQKISINNLFMKTQYILRAAVMISIITLMGFGSAHQVVAAQQKIEINGVCCEKYKVYDHEDREEEGVSPYGNPDDCYVLVDLDPPITEEDIVEAKEEVEEGGEPGVLDGFVQAGKSLISPLAAIFETSGIKRDLKNLAAVLFNDHTQLYHRFLDEQIFGKAIEKVSEFERSSQLQEYLDELDEAEEGCSVEDPRPDCVIERAFCSYEKYVGVLFHQSGKDLVEGVTDLEDLSIIYALLQNRDRSLLEEARHSYQAMDTAIAVYDQFYQTYRLHLKFKDVIEALVKVRNVTSYLRQLVGCLPNKFVGAYTTQCN